MNENLEIVKEKPIELGDKFIYPNKTGVSGVECEVIKVREDVQSAEKNFYDLKSILGNVVIAWLSEDDLKERYVRNRREEGNTISRERASELWNSDKKDILRRNDTKGDVQRIMIDSGVLLANRA